MITLSEENYLKAIYHLGQQGTMAVSTNAIADKIETKASSVTDMIKKLADKNLANYVKYQGVSLTNEGRLAAVLVIRKHRLWEVFLVNKLNFSWDEVHDIAEQLEHIKSLKLVNELDAFLEYPTHDPHGDPIPDKDGNITKIEKVLLSQIHLNTPCICVGVKNSSKEFLQYLDKIKLELGSPVEVLDKEPFDQSMVIKLNNQRLGLSALTANNLFVKIV
tara:strand:+ start:5871 stop:6527 length:657 start_codon:yes stop_codon:yes gene_type:complete